MLQNPENPKPYSNEYFIEIRNQIKNKAALNYESFKTKEDNIRHLISIRYTGGKRSDIFFYNGQDRIILPYGNLEEKIKSVFEKDIDKSFIPTIIKQNVKLPLFPGMPAGFATYIGEEFWQTQKIFKLNSGNRAMVIQNKFYSNPEKDNEAPKFEVWVAQKNNNEGINDNNLIQNSIVSLQSRKG